MSEQQIFTEQKFTDLDWSEKVLENIKFEKCTFTGVNFSESDLVSITFDRCKFVSCKFSVSNIKRRKTVFSYIRFVKAGIGQQTF